MVLFSPPCSYFIVNAIANWKILRRQFYKLTSSKLFGYTLFMRTNMCAGYTMALFVNSAEVNDKDM